MTQKENNKSSACQRFATKVQDSSAHGPRIWTEGKGQTAIMATDCNPKIELKGSGWNYQADSYFFFFFFYILPRSVSRFHINKIWLASLTRVNFLTKTINRNQCHFQFPPTLVVHSVKCKTVAIETKGLMFIFRVGSQRDGKEQWRLRTADRGISWDSQTPIVLYIIFLTSNKGFFWV